MKITLLVIAMFTLALPAFGQNTGFELLGRCKADPGVSADPSVGAPGETFAEWMATQSHAGYCAGLIRGVASIGQSEFMKSLRTSVPAGVTPVQTERVVLKYLENHPEKLHEPDWLLVALALHDAWPAPAPKAK